jgi:type I restriction enzyme S subunit
MSWPTATLSEATKIISGGTPKSGVTEFWEGDVEWITPKDMGKMTSIYASDTGRKITELGLSKSSAKLIDQNSVILSTRAPIGHLAINTVPMATNQGCRGLVPKENLETKFLFYFLFKNVDLLNELGSGTTFKELSKGALEKVLIPLPPIPEQKRIVALLDAVFADLEQTRVKTKQNLKNATELFDSYLNAVFENNVSGTEHHALNDICELIVDCEHKTAPKQETGYPSIRTPNIGKGVLILEGVNRVSEETYITWTKRAIPKEDDLILAREAPAGNIGVIPKNVKVCLGQRTVLIRPKKDKFISKYLAFLILSSKVQKQLLSHSTGATVQHINMKDIRAFKIYNLPSLVEQEKVVNGIDKILNETKKLETIYSQKSDNLDELKKSILQKAFNGELTTTAK